MLVWKKFKVHCFFFIFFIILVEYKGKKWKKKIVNVLYQVMFLDWRCSWNKYPLTPSWPNTYFKNTPFFMCCPIPTQLSYWSLNDVNVSLKGQNMGEEGYPKNTNIQYVIIIPLKTFTIVGQK